MRHIGFFSNPWLLLAWLFTIGFQVAVVYVPFRRHGFETVPPAPIQRPLPFVAAVPIVLLSAVYTRSRWRSAREGAR